MDLKDAEEAGAFERALKRRLSPFVTQLRCDEENAGHVRIGARNAPRHNASPYRRMYQSNRHLLPPYHRLHATRQTHPTEVRPHQQ